MKTKHIISIIVLIILITGAIYFARRPKASDIIVPPTQVATTKTATTTAFFKYVNSTDDNIIVDLPYPGAVTGKEFSVIGKARGTWFFEGSFPVQILDKDGNVLAAGPAKSTKEWMTTDFIPFRINFKVPETYVGPATVLLMKDNPSGEAEHDSSVSFPITVE